MAAGCRCNQYTGGIEHRILHLLYARFFTKVLYDLGMVGFTEPFTSLLNQGMVVMHGAAMSKSRGNLVEPSEIIDEHGADVARLTMLFAGPFEDDVDWADVSPEGMARWVQRVWRATQAAVAEPPAGEPGWPDDPELARVPRTTAAFTETSIFSAHTASQADGAVQRPADASGRAGAAPPSTRRSLAAGPAACPAVPFVSEICGGRAARARPPGELADLRLRWSVLAVLVSGRRQGPRPDRGHPRRAEGDFRLACPERVRTALGDRQVSVSCRPPSWSSCHEG